MKVVRVVTALIGVGLTATLSVGCGSHPPEPASTPAPAVHHGSGAPGQPNLPGPGGGYWDDHGQPVNGGPVGADGSTGNGLTQQYCAHTQDPACPAGSYAEPDATPDPAPADMP